MKIAMISSGSSIHVKKIVNELVRRGHEITLYTLPNHDKLVRDFDKRVKIIRCPIKGKLGYYINMPFIRRQIKKSHFDVINVHYASGYGTLARLVGLHPVSLAVFGSDVFEFPFKSKWNMNMLIKNLDNADIISSTSNAMAGKLREFYHRDRQIYITPFGVDLNVFYPRLRTGDKRVFTIGIIKKIEKIYGHEFLLKAFKLLREEYGVINSQLIIYGRGSAESEYRMLSHDLNLDERIIFKGFIQNEKVPEALSQLDVMCLPSTADESFGVAAVEAMACGVIVVASDALGFQEVIEDGETGYIVPKKNERELAKVIYKVYLLDKNEKIRMREKAIDRVKRLYNFKDNMDEYERVLTKAKGKKDDS